MSQVVRDLPHGTTIVAATCDHGVVLAGDRRATAGSLIARRDLEKVYRSDELPHSVNRSGTIDLLAIRSSGGMSLLQFKFI